MRVLFLLRHSLTVANEARLYCGWSDPPLSPAGRDLALASREALALPECERYFSSGLKRADETLRILTGHSPDTRLPELREMSFGAFELLGYDVLCQEPAYLRWIEDASGRVSCPGGESSHGFRQRVLKGAEALLDDDWRTALAVIHGGVIVRLMQAWFPDVERGFYDWQPAACAGYRIEFEGRAAVRFEPIP